MLRAAAGIVKPPGIIGCSAPPVDLMTGEPVDRSARTELAERATAVRVLLRAIGWRARRIESFRVQVRDSLTALGWGQDASGAASGLHGGVKERLGCNEKSQGGRGVSSQQERLELGEHLLERVESRAI